MARLKKDLHKYVEIREEDYLQLVENTMIVEAMKLAGVENFPMESCPPNLGRQTYRDTRQTRQSTIR